MNEIKKLRKKLGLTQDQFAVKLGVAPFTIRRWERGENVGNIAKRLFLELFQVKIK